MELTQSYKRKGQGATIRIEYYINHGLVCKIEHRQRCGITNWIQLVALSLQELR